MNLAYKYPIIFWNTANLIVDSDGYNVEDFDDEDEDNESDDSKKKNNTINFGKIASVIGKFKSNGIQITAPDINKSSYTFTPDVSNNTIAYGLRGITKVPSSLVKEIINNRPYSSIDDFLKKVKIQKLQMISLIKSGAFDVLEGEEREVILKKYMISQCDLKKQLTTANMPALIEKDLIPKSQAKYKKLYLFNKFLLKHKKGDNYELSNSAISYISDNFDSDLIVDGNLIEQKVWKKLYDKEIKPLKDYIKANQDKMLEKINDDIISEEWNKYCSGTISRWEMESISFYYHEHELANYAYMYDDFFKLPESPEVDYTFTTDDGTEVKMFKLRRIIGTVVAKDKNKNTVTLLTPSGIVTVKVYKNQFSYYDKKISDIDADGKKTGLEDSWFKRGTLLMVQGVRRGDNFSLKKYKSSSFPVISKIDYISEENGLVFAFDRINAGDED